MNPDHMESSLTLNILDRKLNATTLKIWQRRVAAEACLETFERQRESNIDKFKYAEEAYFRLAPTVLQKYPSIIPYNLTVEQLCSDTLITNKSPTPTQVTGAKIWRTMWESMNTYIANKMIPTWNKVRPALKDGSIPSGVQNFEPALQKLRRELFDLEFNSVVLIKKRIEKHSSLVASSSIITSSTTAGGNNNNSPDGEEEDKNNSDVVDGNSNNTTAATSSSSAAATATNNNTKKRGSLSDDDDNDDDNNNNY